MNEAERRRSGDDFDIAEMHAREERERAAFEAEQYAIIAQCLDDAIAAARALWPHDDGSSAYLYVLGEAKRREAEFFRAKPKNAGVYVKEPISAAFRRQVFERDAYRCVQCGDWHNLTVDHIVPERAGGELTMENCQTLCQPCNSKKGARV